MSRVLIGTDWNLKGDLIYYDWQDSGSINRNRLEFKVRFKFYEFCKANVLIGTDWNLKFHKHS